MCLPSSDPVMDSLSFGLRRVDLPPSRKGWQQGRGRGGEGQGVVRRGELPCQASRSTPQIVLKLQQPIWETPTF